MLDELRIRGLGVIDEALLPLGSGLTVVTGETGAGKTMVVTGLLLLFGGRAEAARVRAGIAQAEMDGRLTIPAGSPVADRVAAAGGSLDDSGAGAAELVLRRTVTAAGRSRAHVGGVPAPVAVLAELADDLLTVHGQSDQLRLARPAAQRETLDRFAGVDLTEYTAAFTAWREASRELADRLGRAAELRRETDLLEHGLAEIAAVDPQPGEDDELRRLAARMAAAEALQAAARNAHDALLGTDDYGAEAVDVTAVVSAAGRTLAQVRGADAELDELAGRLTELGALAADLGAELRSYADAIDTDPARLAAVEERRSALGALMRKYCDEPEPSIAAVLRWAAAARDRLAGIDVSDDALARLRDSVDGAAARVAELAATTSDARRSAARRLADAVSDELGELAMTGACLDIEVRPRPAASGTLALPLAGRDTGVGPDGADEVEFLLRPHAGAPALPIARGASGGELSRVMLALEVCLAGADPVPTMVFDEVDAGVGGAAAVEVGRRLARLAADRQVLVVTHLPQVAAFADRHVVVRKTADTDTSGDGGGGVTSSDVEVVTGDERLAELARMLGGADTVTARRHAAELLRSARR